MKKGLIFATTLAMALGVGVAVGAHQSKAVEVKAAPVSTIYCKVTQSWWTDASASVGAYCWKNSDTTQNNGWPGVKMTAVAGQTGLWSYSVPSGYDKVIFTRLNGDGSAYWGAKTDDQGIQSVKNCFTITSEEAQWEGDGKTAQGSWSVYPTVAPEYHLLGDFNSWNDSSNEYIMTVDAGDANHYTLEGVDLTAGGGVKVCDVKNDDWYGDHGGNVVVPEDGEYDVDFYVHADNEVNVVLNKKQVVTVSYSLSYNSGTIDFALDDEHKPGDSLHQYKATINTAWRARELQFYKKVGDAEPVLISNIGVDWDGEAPVPGNNIVGDTTIGFRIYTSAASMDVYLKEYENGYSLWGTEYAENSYSMSRLFVNLSLDQDFVPDDTYVKQYKTSSAVSIAKLTVSEANQNYYISENARYGMQKINMETAGQNNAVAVNDTYFNVHNDCQEVVYLKMKADLSLWLYIGGYVEEHSITIGGHSYPLTKSTEEGKEYEYLAHNVTLSAGDAVTAYTIEGETVSGVTSKKVANNNLKENKTILADVQSADIVYDKNNNTLWISGLPAAGQHLLINGHTAVEMHHTDPFDGYDQFASGSMAFAANDTIKVINTGADNSYAVEWCPENVATSTDLAGKFVYDSEKQEMKCVAACSAAVYLKIKEGVDEVYFGDVPEYISKAIKFANGFKSAMATACSAEEEGKQAAVKAAWELQATAFAALEEEVKDELKLGELSLVDEVIEFGERYAGIYRQLGGKYELEDFLESGIVPNVRFYNELDVTGDNSAMIIVISIAAASALAFTLLLVFKKKKQK